MPLTSERAKPAVPFGGRYRLIDFVLSNLVNSGFMKIKVLTQYKSDSLSTHISRGWRLSTLLDTYIELVPPQQRIGPTWYRGSADALYQNLNLVTDENPDYVIVFGADHIYKMDVRDMLEYHKKNAAHLTVAAIPVPTDKASAFGCIKVNDSWRMIDFIEKPENPPEMPDRPGWTLVSMGNYIFTTAALVRAIENDASQNSSDHDFGKNIVPALYKESPVYVYDFSQNSHPGMIESERSYWRDVGTIESYWRCNMDLVNVTPIFNLYNTRWPIHTYYRPIPPAKFVHDTPEENRVGMATESLVSEGCIVSGGRINRCVLSHRVRINSFSEVNESILFENVEIGRHAKLNKVIVEKNVSIPPNTEIGFDLEADKKRFDVCEGDITVVTKKHGF
jgi:glucose-1-phosphate adenylyltransferase